MDGRQVKRLLRIGGFGHHIHVGDGLQQSADAGTNQSVVINNQNTHGEPTTAAGDGETITVCRNPANVSLVTET
ncbi:hypothetical protein GCM10007235_12630 [Pseudoxanthomonas indica]|nr:hypothetical protein GCM10007235_12630 [Pseudoxanthomonas indica]